MNDVFDENDGLSEAMHNAEREKNDALRLLSEYQKFGNDETVEHELSERMIETEKVYMDIISKRREYIANR